MSQDLLLEVGTEEIPAGYLPPALAQLHERIKAVLQSERLAYADICTFATPRRIVLHVAKVAEKQEDIVQEIQGPAKRVAFDDAGQPTKAAIGFAKGKGVTVEDLEIKETEKGEYVTLQQKISGKTTLEIMTHALPEVLLNLNFPKTMRWDDSGITFTRPIRWLMCLFGETVVPLKLGRLTAGNITYGHRFMSPEPKTIENVDYYWAVMKESYVILNPKERRHRIHKMLDEAAERHQGKLVPNEDLIDTVTYLVEFPSVVTGKFDPKFLNLPDKIIIAALDEHQKCFAVTDEHGKLKPLFLNIIGSNPEYKSRVIAGNERVLAARLEDANFFFTEDTKTPLATKVERLKGVTFQADLGSVYEKMERIQSLGQTIAERCDANPEWVSRAALLCKADLVTLMVGEKEYAKLQGYIGMEYALKDGENPVVAKAINEHYMPRFADDTLPETLPGAIISIADKIDTIVGCFGVGLVPSGSQDPYALRRQATGVIRILLDREFEIRLSDLVQWASTLLHPKFKAKADTVQAQVIDFLQQRLETILTNLGFAYDEVDATLASDFNTVHDALKRVRAVSEFRQHPDFEALITGFKRVVNILKNAEVANNPDENLFTEESERRLFKALVAVEKNIGNLVKTKDYPQILKQLVMLRTPIDTLFDEVMVMAEDEAVRENRLRLLARVRQVFTQVADFSRIVIS
ncbi:MAG: glycine--tRNA ligase subunit beta [Gemmatimonadetes bacterium]|nr:MAG: glycine--tRNA ligase subunit beta [Gemmatimonadota bacterium]